MRLPSPAARMTTCSGALMEALGRMVGVGLQFYDMPVAGSVRAMMAGNWKPWAVNR